MPNVQSMPGLLLNHQTLSAFIRSVADLLRGDYKQSDYGKDILPFTVFRAVVIVSGYWKRAAPSPNRW
jgi:type I restriction-modification system DNA methylase subunit